MANTANNMAAQNFKGCPAIVYDNYNNYIAKTIISNHNKKEMFIEIPEDLESIANVNRLHIAQVTRLKILIIHPGGAVEFNGTRRRIRNGISEIALFNERPREARTSVRHKLEFPATITNMTDKSGQKYFNPPLDITVENISTTGALITAPPGHFGLEAVLEIHLNIQGSDVMLRGRVVRRQEQGEDPATYGCRFIFDNNNPKEV